MHKVSLQQAVKMTGKSESTLRRDVKKGKVSAGRDARGHLQFDIAELQRVYGEMKTTGEDAQSTEQGNGKAMTGHDGSPKIVALLENQIQDLKAQLEKADAQLEIATTEKTKLLDLLSAEKDEKRALMPPVDEKPQKSPNWLLRLVGAR